MMEQAVASNLGRSLSLDGQVALIVGGYGAIGTTISQTLANAGAIAIVAGRTEERARELATEISNDGNQAEGVAIDACSVTSIRETVDGIAQRHGTVDVLVNCVGFNKEQALLDLTEEAFDEVYRRTLRPGMFLSQAVAGQQVHAGRGGSQIHLLSLRSSLGFRDRGYSAFCAAKGGLAAIVKQLSAELGPHGISINGVGPGLVLSRKNSTVMGVPSNLSLAVKTIPMGRLATPLDVANAVAFFSSPHSRFISGQILYVDGGQSVSLA